MFAFDRHFPAGSASRPIRPTLAFSYSAVTVTPASIMSYHAPTAASRARSAMGMYDRDGAASDCEGRSVGMLSPDQQRWIVASIHPNTPAQNVAAVRLQGSILRVPGRSTAKNTFLNASTTSTSSVGSSWSNVAIAPSKSAPHPPDLRDRQEPACPEPARSVAHIACGTRCPHRPRAMSSLARAKVAVPLPAGAVEVKPSRSRAMGPSWMSTRLWSSSSKFRQWVSTKAGW